jgi:hypothetical protein
MVESIFDFMAAKSLSPDRIRYAQIAGTAARYAHGWQFTAEEKAEAIAELKQAAAGQTCWPNAQAQHLVSARAGWSPPATAR